MFICDNYFACKKCTCNYRASIITYNYKNRMGNFTGFQKSDDFYIHPRLGQIKRIQKQEGPQLIQHRVLVQSQQLVLHWIQSLDKLYKSPCQDIILLPKSHFYQQVGYCGHHCQVFMLFDDYMFSLKDQIRNRNKIRRHFAESSVWQILYKLIKAQIFLQKLQLRIGNVKTENFLVNQQGQIKIISQYSFPSTESNMFSQAQQKNRFFSPEELEDFKIMSTNTKIQINQNEASIKKIRSQQFLETNSSDNLSQIFSIGMTLLQICTMQNSQQIYVSNAINQIQISRRLSSLKSVYSSSLLNLIFQMVKIDPQRRIRAENIYEALKHHQQSIISHKPFELKHDFKNCSQSKTSNRSLETQNNVELLNKKSNKEEFNKISTFFPFLRSMRRTQSSINNKKLSAQDKKNQLNMSMQSAYVR